MANYTLSARLTADAKDFVKGLDKAKNELNGLQKFSKSIGNKMQDFGSRLNKVGDSLTNKITKPALVAGTALAGLTIAKGFKRLVGIDTAKAKLEGLGHTTKEVDGIMKSALDSVKGTAFGLDEAATIAASAVAAGIEPGKELTKYLTLTGDAAAIAGVELDDMGGVFNKVSTQNKAYNSELKQLADKGLPIYKWLAEEAGTTEEAIFDMASNGAIDTQMFLSAIDKNIGGAAKIMGEKSFMAAMANVGAAIGRIGAAFLDGGEEGKGFFSQLKPLMADFTDKIDSMGDKAEEMGAKFGEAFANFIEKIKEVKAFYDDLAPATQDIIKKTALWGSVGAIALGPLLKVIGTASTVIGFLASSVIPKAIGAFKLLAPVITFLTSPLGIVIGLIVGIGAALVYAYNKSESFREKVDTAFTFIKDTIMEVFTAISDFVMEIWGQLTDWYSENSALIQESTEIVWGAIQAVIERVMEIIVPIIEVGWLLIKTVTQTVWNIIKTVIQMTLDVLLGIIKATMQMITGDWEGALNALNEIGSKLWNRLKDLVIKIIQILKDNLSEKWNEIKSKAQETWEEIKQKVIDKAQEMKQRFIDKVQEMKQNFIDKANDIVQSAQDKFNDVKEKVLKPIEDAKNKISEIVEDIKGFFSNMKLSLPKISMPKLPKFSLSGKFSLMPPSVPRIGVNWNAKGGIFNKPTIFGTANAGLQGVGEAGSEAIIPLNNRTLGSIGKGISKNMNSGGSSGITQNITIYSPEATSPSENARKMKRASQELAMEWR